MYSLAVCVERLYCLYYASTSTSFETWPDEHNQLHTVYSKSKKSTFLLWNIAFMQTPTSLSLSPPVFHEFFVQKVSL